MGVAQAKGPAQVVVHLNDMAVELLFLFGPLAKNVNVMQDTSLGTRIVQILGALRVTLGFIHWKAGIFVNYVLAEHLGQGFHQRHLALVNAMRGDTA